MSDETKIQEPSEAEIEAAVRAFYPLPASHKISEQSIFYMRASLIAAAKARKEAPGTVGNVFDLTSLDPPPKQQEPK